MTNIPFLSASQPQRQKARIHILTSLLIFLSFASLTIAKNTHAQENNIKVDYKKIESVGLLTVQDKGSFGNGVLKGTKRSELTALLKKLKQTNWVALRQQVKNFLLTEADPEALTQDILITHGNDLLTLRLNALLELGYNREAFELYRKASETLLEEPTILAGIYSMLLNREKGLACLEVKTAFPRFKNTPPWETLNHYCKTFLPGEQTNLKDNKDNKDYLSQYSQLGALFKSADYAYEYDPKGFASLSPIERAILTAEGRISTKYIAPQTLSEIPPEHIAVILLQPDISDLQKTLLLGAAIEFAIEPPETMTDFYETLLKKQEENTTENDSGTSPTDDIITLAKLYKETSESWTGTGRAEKISQAITLANKYSDKLLLPFLPIISKLDIDQDISLTDAFSVSPLYLFTPQSIPEAWIEDLIKMSFSENKQKEIIREKLIMALFLLHKNPDVALRDKVYNHLSTYPLHATSVKDIKNIIENIDTPPINNDKVQNKDINGFDLEKDKRYTMPPYHVLSTLKQASENQDIGVSLLLSSCILSRIDEQETYIGTLGDIASALNNIGKKTTPRHILAQALIRTGNKTKTIELKN